MYIEYVSCCTILIIGIRVRLNSPRSMKMKSLEIETECRDHGVVEAQRSSDSRIDLVDAI